MASSGLPTVRKSPSTKVGLTKVFLERPTLAFVLIALIFIAGFMALRSLVQQQFPNVVQPTITVTANYSGAPATVMRDDVVIPIEDQLAGALDLYRINSVVQSGTARISAVFTITSDTSTDLANTLKAVQAASSQLPKEMLAPTIQINDPSESTVVTLEASSATLPLSQLSMLVINRIGPALQQVPGISLVSENGTVTPAYEVVVNPYRLAAANLTLNDVYNVVSADNQRLPGGYVYSANRQTQVDIRGDVQTPQSIAYLLIAPPSGAAALPGITPPVGTVNPWTVGNTAHRIGDVASVVNGNEPRLQIAEINGQSAVLLSVQKTDQASEVNASNAVIAALPRLEREFPAVSFRVINVESRFTEQQISGVERTLMEGIVLTGIVMLFFLGNYRAAIVVLIAIPTSLSVALFVMKLLNLTLDIVSLLAMTLVIGILVDDSTVTLENIVRHYKLGEDPFDAALRGRSEIGMAAIVITLVDVVVFLPIAFMPGQVGRFLQEFGIVVTIATLTSLFVSFTITPTLAGLWALESMWKPWRIIRAFQAAVERITDWYATHVLRWGLAHPFLVLGVCVVSFVGSVALVPLGFIGEEFIPPEDRGEIFLQIAYPTGTPLSTTQVGALTAEHVVDQSSDLFADATVAGAYAAPFGGFVSQINVAQVHAFLKDNRKNSTSYWVNYWRTTIPQLLPGAIVTVVPVTNINGGNSQPFDMVVSDITGGDPTPYAIKLYQVLLGTPGAVDINSTASALAPEIELEFNRARARSLDVDIGQASIAAEAAFGGAIATSFELPTGEEQVQIIYPISAQHQVSQLLNIPVRTTNGNIVHMGDFAHITEDPQPPLIIRIDLNNAVHLLANPSSSTSLGQLTNAFLARAAAVHLPSNITLTAAPLGQGDFMNQLLAGIGAGLILSVILVFLLMVALYNSYMSPFIIMFSVPVAAVGGILALFFTHETLNMFSLIGTILLVGIATKNGILLVDYANTLRKRGESKLVAIQESARTRFRPIVMTSLSVIAGNIPLALALEPGSSVRSSLGVVVCGGAFSSLVLTLVLVPVMYMWLAPEKLPVEHHGEDNGVTQPSSNVPASVP
jgi:HAE1 family hydrophobic/amphiphilic exporter-1